jgi:membrane-associated phospholipid phosphatase
VHSVALLLACLLATPAVAADRLDTSAPEARRSVYVIKPAIDVPLVLAGVVVSALPYALASRLITPSCPCDRARVSAFDRGVIGNHSNLAGFISDATVGLTLTVPVVLSLVTAPAYATFIEDATVFAETIAINGGLVSATKLAVRRPLPRVYEGDRGLLDNARGYRAFYSGHTSYTFAALSAASMTIGMRTDRYLLPWLITGLAGTSVAIERLLGGYHFPSDVIVGALVGTAVGIAVPLLHARKRSSFRLAVLPASGGMMLSLVRGQSWQ